MRVGVYADVVYRQDEDGISVGQSFVTWVVALAPHVESLTLFGRVDPVPGRAPHPVPAGVSVVPLSFYPSLRKVGAVAGAVRSSRREVARHVAALDVLVVFGPHPLGVIFSREARRAGIPVVVGVRQDFPEYIKRRAPRAARLGAAAAASGLEWLQRRVARRGAALVVGEAMAKRYRDAGACLVTGVSLVADREIVGDEVLARPWPGAREVLAVTRLDSEKNPLLLVEILALLRNQDDWHLVIAGDGPLKPALLAYARQLGLTRHVQLLGATDRPVLRDLYLNASVFLHVSWTEGQPQVLYEAAAAAVPIVATAVGSVAHALANGLRGELIPPGDAVAAAEAIGRLADTASRERKVRAALSWVRDETTERQAERVAAFLAQVATEHRGSC